MFYHSSRLNKILHIIKIVENFGIINNWAKLGVKMESFFTQTPSITMDLINEDEGIKRVVYDFVCRIERASPYRSSVRFGLVEKDSGHYTARLEVMANSFEILLTKKNPCLTTLLSEFDTAFDERLKPWLEGRFSA